MVCRKAGWFKLDYMEVQMKHLLLAKGLWQVVEGTEVQPKEAQAAAEFQKKSEKALATIVLGINTSKL